MKTWNRYFRHAETLMSRSTRRSAISDRQKWNFSDVWSDTVHGKHLFISQYQNQQQGKEEGLRWWANEDSRITFALLHVELCHHFLELDVPAPGCLLQDIKAFSKATGMFSWNTCRLRAYKCSQYTWGLPAASDTTLVWHYRSNTLWWCRIVDISCQVAHRGRKTWRPT